VKKAILILIASVLVILGGLVALMYHDTNELTHHVKELFRGEIDPALPERTPSGTYNQATHYESLYPREVAEVDITILRLFVLHDFNDGFMEVYYFYEARDSESRVLCGSWGIRSHWVIHKEDGVWQIVEIHEDP